MITITSNLKELRNKSGIYKFTFPSGKVYIGQSIDLYKRINQHIWQSKHPIRTQFKLYKALKYYGIENIQLDILWCIDRPLEEYSISKELDKLEQEYILQYDSYKNGYNSTEGGKGALGYNVSNEQKEGTSWRNRKPTRKEKIDLIYEYGINEAADILQTEEEILLNSVNESTSQNYIRTYERRSQSAINNSRENLLVMDLISKNYEYLWKRCVKSEIDEDLFNDTLLHMTVKYNEEDDFLAEFIHQFYLLKMQYNLDKKVLDFNVDRLDDHPEIENKLKYEAEEPVLKPVTKLFSNEFINSIKNALPKEARETEE